MGVHGLCIALSTLYSIYILLARQRYGVYPAFDSVQILIASQLNGPTF